MDNNNKRDRSNIDDDLVLIVPIRENIEFEEMKIDNAYVCQNRRPFKGGSFKKDALYIAFYHDGVIRAIAKIKCIEDDVDITNNTKIANPCIYKPSDNDKLRTVISFCKDSFREVNIPIDKIIERDEKRKSLQNQWYIKVIKELLQ